MERQIKIRFNNDAEFGKFQRKVDWVRKKKGFKTKNETYLYIKEKNILRKILQILDLHILIQIKHLKFMMIDILMQSIE